MQAIEVDFNNVGGSIFRSGIWATSEGLKDHDEVLLIDTDGELTAFGTVEFVDRLLARITIHTDSYRDWFPTTRRSDP